MLFHQRHGRVDAPPGGDGEAHLLAVAAHDVDELLQGCRVAYQGLVQVRHDQAVAIALAGRRRAGGGQRRVPPRQRPHLVHIGLGVGLPGVQLAHLLDAIGRGPLPGILIPQQFQQGRRDLVFIQGVDEFAALAVADDIHRPAVFGCHHRQAAGRGFQQGQSEGLGERGVDEDPAPGGDHTVDFGHVCGPVMLGHGHPPVQVIGIHDQQQVGQHCLGAVFQVAYIVAIAGNYQQVGGLLQLRVFAIGVEQGRQVLALVGTGQGQDQGFVGVAEKAVDGAAEAECVTWPGWVELLQVGAGRYDHHALRVVVVVQPVLLLDLVVGAGDHQVGIGQHGLLGVDAALDVVGTGDLLPG